MTQAPLELDAAVVGGGVAGLYACHLLHAARPDWSVRLYESSGRFGGRIETVEMDGFLAEYGPMRFERQAQPLLMGLIAEMGLKTMHFAPYMADESPESLFDLEADEGRPRRLGPINALDLLRLGVLRALAGHRGSAGDLNDPRDPAHAAWWSAMGEPYYAFLRREGRLEGELLRDMGFWNALARVLSHRAVNHIIQYGTFYHVVHYNPNAAEWLIFWLRGLHPGDALVGIRQGVQALTDSLAARLAAKAPERLRLETGLRLEELEETADGRVRLDLRPTDGGRPRTVLARRVILALPWSPLRCLSPCLPRPVRELTDGVIPIPLVKCFFVTRSPWWDASTPPQTLAHAVPCRELHYAHRQASPEEGGGQRGMVMVYGERPSMDFWKFLARDPRHLQAELDGDQRLPDCYRRYLAAGPDGRPVAAQDLALTAYGIRDWSREPFEAGCHIWKPGLLAPEAIETLTGFNLGGRPEGPVNAHICGEAYSDFQGFIEGALRTAAQAVEKAVS